MNNFTDTAQEMSETAQTCSAIDSVYQLGTRYLLHLSCNGSPSWCVADPNDEATRPYVEYINAHPTQFPVASYEEYCTAYQAEIAAENESAQMQAEITLLDERLSSLSKDFAQAEAGLEVGNLAQLKEEFCLKYARVCLLKGKAPKQIKTVD